MEGCTTRTVKPLHGGTGGVFCVGPFHEGRKREGRTLTKTQYLKIRNTITGEMKIQKGPCLYFFDAYEEESNPIEAKALGPTEFLRISNELTGELRVERGPQIFFPGPYDDFHQVENAISLRHNQYIKYSF